MNTPDPLQGLRDIHLPVAPSWWPPAIGWWLLVTLLIIVTSVSVWWGVRVWSQRRAIRSALKSLTDLRSTEQDTQQTIIALSILMRRVALAYYPRRVVAGLQGDAWLNFLDEVGQTTQFSRGVGRLLVTAPYQAQCQTDIAPLFDLMQHWIKHCRNKRKGEQYV